MEEKAAPIKEAAGNLFSYLPFVLPDEPRFDGLAIFRNVHRARFRIGDSRASGEDQTPEFFVAPGALLRSAYIVFTREERTRFP